MAEGRNCNILFHVLLVEMTSFLLFDVPSSTNVTTTGTVATTDDVIFIVAVVYRKCWSVTRDS